MTLNTVQKYDRPIEHGLRNRRFRCRLFLLTFLLTLFNVNPAILLTGSGNAAQVYAATSDVDHNDEVNLADVAEFSSKYLHQEWQDVDWCEWIQDDYKNKQHLGALFDFINEHFQCDYVEPEVPVDPMAVVNKNDHPVRLNFGPDGKLYVTDFKVNSLFVYNTDLVPIAQLKDLKKPLGVAVDDWGFIYVGNSGRNNVEIYDPLGEKVAVIGEGLIKKPNDMEFDRQGNLYIVDTQSKTVWVCDPNGNIVNNIGSPGSGSDQFTLPMSLAIAYNTDPAGRNVGELFVADQGQFKIKVFDLNGNYLRSFGRQVRSNMMGTSWYWKGMFNKLRSLAVDKNGKLHALDNYMEKVQILNSVTGKYISHYGASGRDPGFIKLPLDIAINDLGQVYVTNFDNHRIEVIYTVP